MTTFRDLGSKNNVMITTAIAAEDDAE